MCLSPLYKYRESPIYPFIEARNSILSNVCSMRFLTNSIASIEFISAKYLRKSTYGLPYFHPATDRRDACWTP